MQRRSVVHAVAGLVLACAALRGALPYPEKHRATLDEANPLVLAVAGVPKVEIVVGRKPSPVVAFAADELRTFLGQAIGGAVAVVPEPTGPLTTILVGAQDGPAAVSVDVAALPRDAFVIKAGDNRIVIAGRDDPRVDPRRDLRGTYERATLFGVYEFLERFVGVRFYFPGPVGTVVPRRPDLQIPGIDLYEEPDCDQRRVYPGPESRWFETLDKKRPGGRGPCRACAAANRPSTSPAATGCRDAAWRSVSGRVTWSGSPCCRTARGTPT